MKATHIKQGIEASNAGDHQLAIQCFEQAYALDKGCGHTLLALLKERIALYSAGKIVDETVEELSKLDVGFGAAGRLHVHFANGTDFNQQGNYITALQDYKKTFGLFHSGSEVDWYFWKLGGSHLCHDLKPTKIGSGRLYYELIPRNLYFYFDSNPPQDVVATIEDARKSGLFNVILFDKELARDYLRSEHGPDALELFDSLRHPSEESDFMRFHLTYNYGGYWSDVDEKLDQAGFLEYLSQLPPTSILVSQSQSSGGPLQSCFFGCTPKHPVMKSCLDILYENCRRHPNLSMWLKTGPGPLTRAIFTAYVDQAIANGIISPQQITSVCKSHNISIIKASHLRYFLHPFEPSYRNDGRDWRVFETT